MKHCDACWWSRVPIIELVNIKIQLLHWALWLKVEQYYSEIWKFWTWLQVWNHRYQVTHLQDSARHDVIHLVSTRTLNILFLRLVGSLGAVAHDISRPAFLILLLVFRVYWGVRFCTVVVHLPQLRNETFKLSFSVGYLSLGETNDARLLRNKCFQDHVNHGHYVRSVLPETFLQPFFVSIYKYMNERNDWLLLK